jgi:hypothetical protein
MKPFAACPLKPVSHTRIGMPRKQRDPNRLRKAMFQLTHIASYDYVVFVFVLAAGGQGLVLLHQDQFAAHFAAR